jgi:SAM-dependent methyltransferase
VPKQLVDEAYSLLECVCPDRSALTRLGAVLACESCGARHPVVDGVPVVLNEHSVFEADEIIRQYREAPKNPKPSWFGRIRKFVPRIGANLAADDAAARINEMLAGVERPRVLVVGGGDSGAGMAAILDNPRYLVVESDVYFGARCNIIADGHDLPFRDGAFDAVICQAVLEHVTRPQDCIDEMHRVLAPRGVFFVDIPFMYPVHMGAYDFTRFSLGGLRLACRSFEESSAGISGGPFQAIAQTTFHSLHSLSRSRAWKAFVFFVLPWFIFWLHYLDKPLRHRAQAGDGASGVYFLGRRSDRRRSEREVIQQYWRYHTAAKRPLAGSGVTAPGIAYQMTTGQTSEKGSAGS